MAAPAIGDKVWFRQKGKNWRGDVCRVVDATTVDIAIHGSMKDHNNGKGAVEHHESDDDGNTHILFGVTEAKLAGTEAERLVDGKWWPRSGKYVYDPRKRWEGE